MTGADRLIIKMIAAAMKDGDWQRAANLGHVLDTANAERGVACDTSAWVGAS